MSSRAPHRFTELLVTATLLTLSLGVLQALNSAGASERSVTVPQKAQTAVQETPPSPVQTAFSNFL